MTRIQPRLLKGFRDYLPEVMIPRVRLLRRISEIFERFGFEPLDTPSIEYAEILLGKAGPEAEKLFYRFRDHGDRDVALRYELTISLARVVAQYGSQLPRPFRRYQMGPVWRAEAPGKGRFREFWQCDVDIVGSHSLLADAECLAVDHAVMGAAGVESFRIHFNNRKLFRGLQEKLGIKERGLMDAVMRAIDKLDKIGTEGVERELGKLAETGLTDAAMASVLEFLGLSSAESNRSRIEAARTFLAGTEEGETGCNELSQVLDHALALGVPERFLHVNLTIVRGLDYYTGTVFETFLDDVEGFGSVMSGGRYDGLVGLFSAEDVPAVGIAVGIDRLLAALEEAGKLEKSQASAKVLVTIFDESCLEYSLQVVAALRQTGIPAEIFLDASAKLQKQLKYANRKGIPLVMVAGPDEMAAQSVTLRDMREASQTQVALGRLAEAVAQRLS